MEIMFQMGTHSRDIFLSYFKANSRVILQVRKVFFFAYVELNFKYFLEIFVDCIFKAILKVIANASLKLILIPQKHLEGDFITKWTTWALF